MGKSRVIHPGFYSSIQDCGRLHYRNLGVPQSGAMDLEQALLLNKCLDNSKNAAVLEMILTGATLQFEAPTVIAISQNIDEVYINDTSINFNSIIQIKSGDHLKIGRSTVGNFMYMAIKDGWQLEKILGSRSMYKGITSIDRLSQADHLSFKSNNSSTSIVNYLSKIKDLQKTRKNSNDRMVIKVFKGPEFESIPDDVMSSIMKSDFSISKRWNRMAFTFETGFRLKLKQIKTSPVQPGTVQMTPNGDLICLMRDAQTSGGYPRVLQVSDDSLNRLSRITSNDVVRFVLL